MIKFHYLKILNAGSKNSRVFLCYNKLDETAGYCLTYTKSQNGMRLISVVMNVDSVKHRTIDTISLLNFGFSNYEKMIIVGENTEIEDGNNIMLDPSAYKVVTSNNIVKVIKKEVRLILQQLK